jgi:hypothetical protein
MRIAILTALLALAAPALATTQAGTGVTLWLADPAPERPSSDARLLYRGTTGSIVRVDAALAATLVASGATPLALEIGESLHVLLVEDAERAGFDGARVLVRSGQEVVVATMPGETPRLSAESRGTMASYSQVIRVPEDGIAWTERNGAAAREPGSVSPTILGMIDDLDPIAYAATWQTLEDFGTRHTYTTQNVQATQWLRDELAAMGLDAEFHEYLQQGSLRRNVVATLPGTVDPTRFVYLTAHLDSTSPTPSLCAPGADDNASGTAAVIEAARVLSQYDFAHSIVFVCFNGEEQGLIGSNAFVADLVASATDVIGNVNADMIAYRGDDPAPPDLVIYANSWSQDLASVVVTAVDDYLGGSLEPVLQVQSMNASDHASFWAYGFDAILAIEDEVLADDFNPYLHTCQDLIENSDLSYAVSSARALMAAVAELAIPSEEVVSVPTSIDPPTMVGLAHPNPTRTGVRIPIRLSRADRMALSIFDARGRRVRTIRLDASGAGSRELDWDGRDEAGHAVADGVYFYRLRSGALDDAGRIVVAR